MRKPSRHFKKTLRCRRQVYRHVPEEYRIQIALWMLRILMLTRAEPDNLLDEDWFKKTVDMDLPTNRDMKNPEMTQLLGEKLKKMERKPLRREGPLYTNLDRLGDLVGLTATDKEVLAFVALLRTQRCLRECAELFEGLTASTAQEVLAGVLGLDQIEVRRALKEDSALCLSGIMTIDRTETDWVGMLDLLDGLDAALLGEPADSRTIFQTYFFPLQPSSLTPADFPHLQQDFSFLQDILSKAVKEGLKGVNILIYGETGTGKTEFAKVLAASLNVQLLEISHENEDSDLEEKHGRFRSFLLAQKVLARKRDSVIIFDEVEDVFPNAVFQFFGRGRQSGRFKAWTNTVLESNPRPAFWLCNEIHQIDPAFRRRFTYALHVRTPVRSVRRKILVKHLHDLPVSQEWIDKMAANQILTPAMIEQACRVAALAGKTDPASLERLMERTLQNNLEVMGLPRELKNPNNFSVTHYSLDFLNSSQDLAELTQGLKQRPAGRLCFYGPPGSGKTAFTHHISQQLDKPLLEKHASDLLSCWVGETEKNIAEMFREAKEEKSILLLDEADSFLKDRRSAQRSWEITQVNELLVQMEVFEGLFICSTNLMDSLDQAVLRRFDLKIQFGFLKPDQAWEIFLQSLDGLGYRIEDPGLVTALQNRLRRLGTLTPGDFATVIRQASILGKPYRSEQFLAELENECRAKTGAGKQVKGFKT